jgi:hypothetical protein
MSSGRLTFGRPKVNRLVDQNKFDKLLRTTIMSAERLSVNYFSAKCLSTKCYSAKRRAAIYASHWIIDEEEKQIKMEQAYFDNYHTDALQAILLKAKPE